MSQRRVAAGVAALFLVLGAAGTALAVPSGTLDQRHECAAGGCNSTTSDGSGTHPDAEYPLWYSGNGNNGASVGLGQTFKAGISGKLTGVELFLSRLDATAPASLTIRITSTSSGVPSATVLASTTVAVSAIPATPGWVSATFATPPTVTANTEYAITLPDLPQQGVSPWLVWGLDSTATAAYTDYARGEAFASVAGSWSTMAGVLNDGGSGTADLAFRTYVQAATRTTPRPTLPSQPPTDAAAPSQGAGGGGTLALFALLGALTAAGLLLPGRVGRRRRA